MMITKFDMKGKEPVLEIIYNKSMVLAFLSFTLDILTK